MTYDKTIIIIVGVITILVGLLLTCTERDFLLGNRDFTKAQQRYIRCRLNKKIKESVSNELTILQDKGYIVGTIAASSSGVAACCNGGDSLVRIPPRTSDKLVNYEAISTKRSKKAGPPSFDLGTCGSEDRRDILTTLRAQQAC